MSFAQVTLFDGSVTAIAPVTNSVGQSIVPAFNGTVTGSLNGATSLVISNDNFSTTLYTITTASTPALAFPYALASTSIQLQNGVIYYWKVKQGGVDVSATFQFTTVTSAMPYLSYPSNGAILSGTATTFSWITGAVGLKYYLEVYDDINFGSKLVDINTTNSYYSVMNTVFTQGGTYYWRVIAKNIAGTVVYNYSNTWQFSMPGLPQPIATYPTGNVTIYNNPPTLYWYPLGYNPKVTEYVVKYRRSDQGYGAVPTASTNLVGTFYTTSLNTYITIPAALDGGYRYYWQVASYDGSSLSSYSPEESFTVYGNGTFVVCYPSYPTGGSTVYTSTPTLYWYTNVFAPIVYYKVKYATSIAGLAGATEYDVTSNSYTTGSLSAGTYYWQVKASLISSTTGFGSYSAPASFVVTSTSTSSSIATPYPSSPTSGTVVSVTNPTLIWSVYSADPLQFQVTWATNPAMTGSTFTTAIGTSGWINSNSFILSGLTAGATYYWQVKARLATTLTEGAWSTVAWFTTAAGSASVVPLAGSPINGTPINNTNATLSWLLPTRSSSTLKYDVQYSKKADFSDAVTINDLDKSSVEVKNLDKNAVYYWRASSKTNSGLISNYSAPTSFNTGSTVTAIENKEELPTQFELSQNYPNPFNPATVIKFSIPNSQFVTLKVYDMLGREVKTLVSQESAAGKYSVDWNGDDNFGNKVATGAYVYRLTAGGFVSVKKMLLIK
jgi:hypothetical protein